MRNNNPPKVVVLQWSTIPSTPLNIILWGFVDLLPPLSHLLHTYKPFNGSTYHYSTSKGLPSILYHMQLVYSLLANAYHL
jgi:hypothetical protein